jgi:small subunit ribosomal protein S20
MPNTKSAAERIRQDARRRLRNQARKTGIKTSIRAFADALTGGNIEQAKSSFQRAEGLLDRAAQRHTIHRNKADRLKSRLARQLHAAGTAKPAAAKN